jgi:hypothetical protein
MKRSRLLIAGVMCYVLFFNTYAQHLPKQGNVIPEKRLLFGKLPEQFPITYSWLDKIFIGPDTGTVRIHVTGNSYFEGTISEKVQMNAHVTTINIKSSNYEGAMLSVSKIRYNDSTMKYIGRIISIQHGDMFELTQENDEVFFKKKKQSVVITE